METNQSKIQKFMEKYKDLFGKYKLTLATIFIVAIYEAVILMLDYEFDVVISFDEAVISRLFLFFSVGAFFVESLFGISSAKEQDKKRKYLFGKIFAYIVAGILALAITFFISLNYDAQVLGISGEYWNNMASRLSMGYVFLLLVAGIFFCYWRQVTYLGDYRFEVYVLNVFSNLCKTFLVYMTLTIGVTLVSLVFDILFMEGNGNLWGACAILVMGFYLAPGTLHALSDVEKENGNFIKMMIQYVLSILTICALVIVYLYVLKIIILWEMPSNEIFSIISTLFCFGMPIWIMVENYREKTKYSFVLSILPYVFAPLILLQGYSIGVRIYHNGMTPMRYVGIMLIIFEIAILIIWHFFKSRREFILIFLCAQIAVSVFVPGINMYSVSNKWQLVFLQKYYEMVEDGVTLSESEYDRLKGSYDYLDDQIEMEKVLEDYYIYDDKFASQLAIQNEEENDLTKVETHHIHCCQMVGELNVEGYSRFNMLNQSDEYDTGWDETTYVDFSDFGFVIRETGEEIRVDISEFADKCIAYEKENPDIASDETSAAMEPFYAIRINEDKVLFINHFEVRYTEGVRDGEPVLEWENMDVSGMLLEK